MDIKAREKNEKNKRGQKGSIGVGAAFYGVRRESLLDEIYTCEILAESSDRKRVKRIGANKAFQAEGAASAKS